VVLLATQVALPVQLALGCGPIPCEDAEEDGEPAESEGQQDFPEYDAPSGRMRRCENQIGQQLILGMERPSHTRRSRPFLATEQTGRNGIGGPLRC